jgi:hypothetical protein
VAEIEVFSELKSASTPKHTNIKKATVECGFYLLSVKSFDTTK